MMGFPLLGGYRRILRHLPVEELSTFHERLGLGQGDNLYRSQLDAHVYEHLTRNLVPHREALNVLTQAALQNVCVGLGVDSEGRKGQLLDRIESKLLDDWRPGLLYEMTNRRLIEDIQGTNFDRYRLGDNVISFLLEQLPTTAPEFIARLSYESMGHVMSWAKYDDSPLPTSREARSNMLFALLGNLPKGSSAYYVEDHFGFYGAFPFSRGHKRIIRSLLKSHLCTLSKRIGLGDGQGVNRPELSALLFRHFVRRQISHDVVLEDLPRDALVRLCWKLGLEPGGAAAGRLREKIVLRLSDDWRRDLLQVLSTRQILSQLNDVDWDRHNKGDDILDFLIRAIPVSTQAYVEKLSFSAMGTVIALSEHYSVPRSTLKRRELLTLLLGPIPPDTSEPQGPSVIVNDTGSTGKTPAGSVAIKAFEGPVAANIPVINSAQVGHEATHDSAASHGLEFIESIGHGAFADVWKCTDSLDRIVAVKIFRPQTIEMATARDHARALARVEHPNVVTVHQLTLLPCPNTGEVCDAIIMSFIEGTTLAEVLANMTLTKDQAYRTAMGILDGLEAIHAAGIPHEDLHDENVMISIDGNPVILDIFFRGTRATVQRAQAMSKDRIGARNLLRSLVAEVAPEQAPTFSRNTRQADYDLMRQALGFALQTSQGLSKTIRPQHNSLYFGVYEIMRRADSEPTSLLARELLMMGEPCPIVEHLLIVQEDWIRDIKVGSLGSILLEDGLPHVIALVAAVAEAHADATSQLFVDSTVRLIRRRMRKGPVFDDLYNTIAIALVEEMQSAYGYQAWDLCRQVIDIVGRDPHAAKIAIVIQNCAASGGLAHAQGRD